MKNKTKWGTRWLNPKAKPVKSKIEGLGVQATKLIKKGEVVAVLGGIIIHKKEIKKYWEKEGKNGIKISDDFFIVPLNRNELKKYGAYNHSCNPNIGFGRESIIIYAIKDIKPGEELVSDYASYENGGDTFKCACGSKNCRKIIKPSDWKIASLQKKYGKYFSPYLKSKIGL